MSTYEAEEFILTMADIVLENRRLKNELKEAKKWEKMYKDDLKEQQRRNNEGMRILFEAGMAGVFTTPNKEDL